MKTPSLKTIRNVQRGLRRTEGNAPKAGFHRLKLVDSGVELVPVKSLKDRVIIVTEEGAQFEIYVRDEMLEVRCSTDRILVIPSASNQIYVQERDP